MLGIMFVFPKTSVCILSDWNRNGPLIWHSLNLLIFTWHVSTFPETWITHQWALMPDPGWLLSLRTNKHVTTNTSVDQTSDELENVNVYIVRESNDALELFTDDVEKHVINQPRIAPCLLLFVETCPLQRTVNQGPCRSQRARRNLDWPTGFMWRLWGHCRSRESYRRCTVIVYYGKIANLGNRLGKIVTAQSKLPTTILFFFFFVT